MEHTKIEIEQTPVVNHWLLWDIVQAFLGLACFIGLLTALYIIIPHA